MELVNAFRMDARLSLAERRHRIANLTVHPPPAVVMSQ